MVPREHPQPSSQTPAFRPVYAARDGASTTERDESEVSPKKASANKVGLGDVTRSKIMKDAHQADGSPRLFAGGRFIRDPTAMDSRSPSQSPFRLNMPSISPAQVAFSAMQYLPVPMIVLNNLKTVVLANEAMGRMLGLFTEAADENDDLATIERLRGQTLSQVGVDMLQDGHPVWVPWESFLDNLIEEMGVRPPVQDSRQNSQSAGDATPTATSTPSPSQSLSKSRRSQDAVVEVVVSRKDLGTMGFSNHFKVKDSEYRVHAKMIITIWELEDRQAYFTLTFTDTQSAPSSLANTKKSIAKSNVLEAADRKTIVRSTPPSVASSRDSNSPSFHTPSTVVLSSTPFPPLGPPSGASQSSTPSLLQKMILIKDALLDNTEMPILAMWKDGSVTFPNKAARKLFRKGAKYDSSLDGFDLLDSWNLYTSDFSRRLETSEFPISTLLKTEQPTSGMRIGMYDQGGNKLIFDVLGEVIRDDTTGEILAGVVTGRDVTVMTEEISQIKKREDEKFRLICDTMPQLVWTTTPEGMHDFFNTRWFSYTGLTPEESLGLGWKLPFHPDDMPETLRRWRHSLATGEPYVSEYRCRSKEGEWRWFLGRALPLRNQDTGEIEKWFGKSIFLSRWNGSNMDLAGTCTDVHESIQTKVNAERTRQQLLSVIGHSHVTLFTVDRNRRVTMFEGALIWDNSDEENHNGSRWYIGESMYTVFNRLLEQSVDSERPEFLQPIEHILDGKTPEDAKEHGLGKNTPRNQRLLRI